MPEITIPHNYTPRPYQESLFDCIANGYRRAVAVWCRRSGKDKTLINLIIKEAMKRVGVYYYFFPTYNQGRKVMWDGIDRDGFKYMDHIPPELRDGDPNKAEMKQRLINGSLFQIIGTDNIDAIMGTNPVGCVFSEYALQNPAAWDLIRPILAENGGWAVFNYTPRGRNHGFILYEMAKNNPEWFCELLTADDTGAVTPQIIQAEREAGMSEEMIKQEFFCSFEAALSSCFFTGALEGHNSVASGATGSITVSKAKEYDFQDDPKGILEAWRFPYYLLDTWDQRHWTYRYCIGSDISEGLGRDYSVAYVFDRHLREIVAKMRTNKINSHIWGDHLNNLSHYYENALIVPERNGSGITTIDRLRELKANLYLREVVDQIGRQVTKQYGYLETREAKQLICGELKTYLTSRKPIYDRHLLAECATFILDEATKRLEADEGFHDDCVIAAALALHGDLYLPKCEMVPIPVTGWRGRQAEASAKDTVWAV